MITSDSEFIRLCADRRPASELADTWLRDAIHTVAERKRQALRTITQAKTLQHWTNPTLSAREATAAVGAAWTEFYRLDETLTQQTAQTLILLRNFELPETLAKEFFV